MTIITPELLTSISLVITGKGSGRQQCPRCQLGWFKKATKSRVRCTKCTLSLYANDLGGLALTCYVSIAPYCRIQYRMDFAGQPVRCDAFYRNVIVYRGAAEQMPIDISLAEIEKMAMLL